MTPTDVQMLIFKDPTLLTTGKQLEKIIAKDISGINTSVNNQPSIIGNSSLSKDPSSAQLITQVPPNGNNLKPGEDNLG